MSKLLSLDLSTSNTGWATFDIKERRLLEYGDMAPDAPRDANGVKLPPNYPEIQVKKIRSICEKILTLITPDVSVIVIEEINRGISRLGQKVLDGLHFMLLDRFPDGHLKKVVFIDSDGANGWRSRTGLGLQLSDVDKEVNKLAKSFNKKSGLKIKKKLVTQKTLACRFVKKTFGVVLDEGQRAKDADIADAISLGWHYLTRGDKK